MDQHKKDQGQQSHGANQQSQRDPAEGSREHVNTGTGQQHDANRQQERGSGQQGEKNRSDQGDRQGGISNRGMGRSGEQQDVPSRGRNRESDR
jgi:hypothetical protein